MGRGKKYVILSEAGKFKEFSSEVEESVLFFISGIRILRLAPLAQDDTEDLNFKLQFF